MLVLLAQQSFLDKIQQSADFPHLRQSRDRVWGGQGAIKLAGLEKIVPKNVHKSDWMQFIHGVLVGDIGMELRRRSLPAVYTILQ